MSGVGKATNDKFGRYIQMVHANKSRLKIWEKKQNGAWAYTGTVQIFEYPL